MPFSINTIKNFFSDCTPKAPVPHLINPTKDIPSQILTNEPSIIELLPLRPERVESLSQVEKLQAQIEKMQAQIAALQAENVRLQAENGTLKGSSSREERVSNIVITSSYTPEKPKIDPIGKQALAQRRSTIEAFFRENAKIKRSVSRIDIGTKESPVSKNKKVVEELLLNRLGNSIKTRSPINTGAKEGEFALQKGVLEAAFNSSLLTKRREQLVAKDSPKEITDITLPSEEEFLKPYKIQLETLKKLYESFSFAYESFILNEITGLEAHGALDALEQFHGQHNLQISNDIVKKAAAMITAAAAEEYSEEVSSSSESSDSEEEFDTEDVEN